MNSPKDYLTDRVKAILKQYAMWRFMPEENREKIVKDLLTLIQQSMEVGISQERERLLKLVSEKVIGKDDKKRGSTWYVYKTIRNNLRAEQRKALSDIGGKDGV